MVSTFDTDRNSDGKGDNENNDNDGQDGHGKGGEYGNKKQGTEVVGRRSPFQTSSKTTTGGGRDTSQRCSISGPKKL